MFLALFVSVHLLIAVVFPSARPESFSPDARRHFRQWLSKPQTAGNDSWLPMAQALKHWRQHPETPIYTQLFFKEKKKFQYPPSSLLLMLFVDTSVDDEAFRRAATWMNIACWPFVLLTILAAGVALMARWRQENDGVGPPMMWPVAMMLIACLYYPMLRSFHLGQAQTLLNGWLALTIVAWATGREGLAGVLVGLACLVKPPLGIIYIWGCFRKKWRFVAAATVIGVSGLVAGLLVFGWENHYDYLGAVSFLGRHGEAFHANQSFNGLMHRLLGTAPPLVFDPHGFPPFNPLIYATTLVGSLLLLGLCLFGPQHASTKGSALDLCVAVLTAIMASPIAWEHHYGSLIVVYALVLPTVIKRLPTDRLSLMLWASSAFLMSHRLTIFEQLGEVLSVFYSYRLFGGLLLFILLIRLRTWPLAPDYAALHDEFSDEPKNKSVLPLAPAIL
ncbi:MAG: glycosyltransferase family 87 protein [Myxococcota bacterium]